MSGMDRTVDVESGITPGELRRGYGPIYRRLSRCGTELTVAEKLVLLNLMERLGQNGRTWPSQATIAEDTGIRRQAVIEALGGLVSKGLLGITRRGRGLTNVYYLDPVVLLEWSKKSVLRTSRSTPGGHQEVRSADIKKSVLRTSYEDLPIEDLPKEAPPSVVGKTRRERKERKALTEEQRARLCEEFSVLGNVGERIDEALDHDAARKRTDMYLYVRGWLRRDLERRNGSANHRRVTSAVSAGVSRAGLRVEPGRRDVV